MAELTEEAKEEMNFFQKDKTYIPGQEHLPVVAYQYFKAMIRFVVTQSERIKELENEVRELKKERNK